MSEFFQAVAEYEFLRIALAAGVLASLACGVVGSYVVTRRISYIAAAVSHCVLGGMGAARYVQVVYGWEAITPLVGAVVSALAAALIIGWITLRARQREDALIGAVWAVGMAVGVLFVWKTPGYNRDLMGYLFGNILLVSRSDLWMIAVLDVIVVGMALLFYNRLLAVCFDEEFARLRGVRVEFYFLLLLCLTALTVVLLVKVVGIILVIALLALPAATVSPFARSLMRMMILSTVLCVFLTTAGLAISYGPDLPTGATTIVLAAAVYLIAIIASHFLSRRGPRRPRIA
jgi:zinc transport system permease protein